MFYLRYYTKKDLGGFAGKAYAFIILIHVDHKNDKGLLEHEKVHVKQFWKNPLHSLFYRFSKDYHLKSEVEAYRKQIEYGADIVKSNASAEVQVWRFEVDKSTGQEDATVEVFLNGVPQGTVDCDTTFGVTPNLMILTLYGHATDDIMCHIDYIRIATGLGEINDADIIQAGAL